MLRRITFFGSSVYFSASVVKISDDKNPSTPKQNDLSHFKCRPSELPLYTPLHELNMPKKIIHHTEHEPSSIEQGVKVLRIEATKVYRALEDQKQNFNDVIETGKAHTKFIVDYLNEPNNTVSRIGAIGIGGLSGFIFALRGGFIRKLLYTGIGAGGIASVCYPQEAGKYVQQGLSESKKAVTIGYNFVMGIKPGNSDVATTTKVPTTISEFKDSLSDLAQSAKDAIFPSKK